MQYHYQVLHEFLLYLRQKGRTVMSKSKKNKKENYLDYDFEKNPDFGWTEKEDGTVAVEVEWKGFYNRIAQKVFKKPKKSEIALDKLGSFVWKQIDGERDLYAISELMKQEFGKDIEPVYERLFKFVEIMRDNKFVILKEVKKNA